LFTGASNTREFGIWQGGVQILDNFTVNRSDPVDGDYYVKQLTTPLGLAKETVYTFGGLTVAGDKLSEDKASVFKNPGFFENISMYSSNTSGLLTKPLIGGGLNTIIYGSFRYGFFDD
jgi:hypothetical protein